MIGNVTSHVLPPGRLDLALQMAKEVDPTLTTDVIRTFFFGKHHLQPI